MPAKLTTSKQSLRGAERGLRPNSTTNPLSTISSPLLLILTLLAQHGLCSLSDNHQHSVAISSSIDISNDVVEPPLTSDQLSLASATMAVVSSSSPSLFVASEQQAALPPPQAGPKNSVVSVLMSRHNSAEGAPAADAWPAGNASSAQQKSPQSADQLFQLQALDQLKSLNASQSPKSNRAKVLEMFNKFFIKARSHDDLAQKEFVRDGVILRLRELGFETSFLQKSRFEFRRRPAYSYNMISILPGKYRQTKRDKIVLVGAHWDSATKAPGVDDNGSGSTCLLEIARLISENRCSFEHTIMLVWFDYEEQGKYGSEFFVNDYLFPLELEKFNSKFIGAFILDMILVRDKEANSQTLPLNLKTRLKDFSDELEREKFPGDFLATWSRRTWDEPLENVFRFAWQDLGHEARTFKAMRPDLPQSRLPNPEERYEWKDFFRSDHASFWFPPLTSSAVRRSPNRTSTANHTSLNAILLTDLGPWRKSYQKCYHSACDDEHLLTDGNLAFMQQVIDSLVLTLMRIGHGECKALAPEAQLPVINSPQAQTNSTFSGDLVESAGASEPTLGHGQASGSSSTTATTTTLAVTESISPNGGRPN